MVSLLSQAFWVEMKNGISVVSCDGAGLQLWLLRAPWVLQQALTSTAVLFLPSSPGLWSSSRMQLPSIAEKSFPSEAF